MPVKCPALFLKAGKRPTCSDVLQLDLLTFIFKDMNEQRFNEELKAISGNADQVRTPQFMGMQKGNTIEQVRTMIKKQKRCKGFEFSIATGTTSFDLQLSGTARLLLGFALVNPNVGSIAGTPDNMTLTVNNEVVIDKVKPFFFTNYLMDDEYYFIPRPLSGTDQIKMDFQNSGLAQTWWCIVYYI